MEPNGIDNQDLKNQYGMVNSPNSEFSKTMGVENNKTDENEIDENEIDENENGEYDDGEYDDDEEYDEDETNVTENYEDYQNGGYDNGGYENGEYDDEEYDEEYDEDEIEYVDDYKDKWRYTFYTVLVFIVLANPYLHKFLDNTLKMFLKKTNKSESHSIVGFVICTIIFTFVVRYMMDLDL